MRRRNSYLLLAVAGTSILGLASASFADSVFVGYSGASGDLPTISSDGGVTVTPITNGTADSERVAFLNALGNNYYYEDFQEVGALTYNGKSYANKTFNDVGLTTPDTSISPPPSAFGLTFNPSPVAALGVPVATTGTMTTSDPKALTFRDAPVGSNTRGDFDEYASSAPVPGQPLRSVTPLTPPNTPDNWYMDLNTSDLGTTVTIDFQPDEHAVGLELNDLIQPNAATVVVSFSDHTSETFGADKETGGKNPVIEAGGTLTTNGTWFLGIDNNAASISSLTITSGKDPITFDNIYVSTAVPLPNTAATMASLLGIVGVFGCWKSLKRGPQVGA